MKHNEEEYNETTHYLNKKFLLIIAGIIIFSFIVQFLTGTVSFFTLNIARWIFWIGIGLFGLLVSLDIFATLSDFINTHFQTPIKKLRKHAKKIEGEQKEIERLINYKLKDEEDLIHHWNELEETEFSNEALAPHIIPWCNHIDHIGSMIRSESERVDAKDFEEKINSLKLEIKELEENKKRLQQSGEAIKKSDKAKFLQQELDNPLYVYASSLTPQQLQWLKEEGYQKDFQWDIENRTTVEMMIKPRSNEGTSHAYLVGALQRHLGTMIGSDNVRIYETKMPDIVFDACGFEWAIEVETGTLQKKNPKELQEKIKALNKNYEGRWFFVVTNKDLVPRYKELGDTTDRANVIDKIYGIVNPGGDQ